MTQTASVYIKTFKSLSDLQFLWRLLLLGIYTYINYKVVILYIINILHNLTMNHTISEKFLKGT